MHIPENYLSPSTCAVMAAAMVPVWARAVKKVKENVTKEKMPLLGIGAAFSFVSMMFNVPLPGGTTGHAVGGTLIALLLGPDAACISVTIALLIQALLFGDGGILAFGANCFNMAFLLPYVGYAVATAIGKRSKTEKGKYIGAAVGSYVGLNVAALAAAIQFGIQPYLFRDAAGHALYCPYGLNVSIPAMMIGHLTLFGVVEALFTVAVYAFVLKNDPGVVSEGKPLNPKPALKLLSVLVILTPLGLLAGGDAWGEWGAEDIAGVVTNGKALGYTPERIGNGWELKTFMPDYAIGNMPEAVGYILSAVIGVAICVIVFRLIAGGMKSGKRNPSSKAS